MLKEGNRKHTDAKVEASIKSARVWKIKNWTNNLLKLNVVFRVSESRDSAVSPSSPYVVFFNC